MARNTDLADVNEIYCAYVLNDNKFPDSASEAQYTKKLKLLSEEQGVQQHVEVGQSVERPEQYE